MNTDKTTRFEKLAGMLLKAVMISGFVLPMAAQQTLATAAAAQEQEESSAAPQAPGHEGIKVHGHWVLDLKDKDGNVIKHRDFQNALMLSGGAVLTSLVTGAFVPSTLLIAAKQSDTPSQIYVMVPAGYANGLLCGSGSVPASQCFQGLTQTMNPVSRPDGCANLNCELPANITLQGQFVAIAPIAVNLVNTYLVACQALSGTQYPVVSPGQCVAGTSPGGTSGTVFTGTTITPLTVSAGQTLAITVVISFT